MRMQSWILALSVSRRPQRCPARRSDATAGVSRAAVLATPPRSARGLRAPSSGVLGPSSQLVISVGGDSLVRLAPLEPCALKSSHSNPSRDAPSGRGIARSVRSMIPWCAYVLRSVPQARRSGSIDCCIRLTHLPCPRPQGARPLALPWKQPLLPRPRHCLQAAQAALRHPRHPPPRLLRHRGGRAQPSGQRQARAAVGGRLPRVVRGGCRAAALARAGGRPRHHGKADPPPAGPTTPRLPSTPVASIPACVRRRSARPRGASTASSLGPLGEQVHIST